MTQHAHFLTIRPSSLQPPAAAIRGEGQEQVNQAEYFQQNAVDGVLPPQHMAALLLGGLPQGDTSIPAIEDGATPAATAPTAPAPAAAPEATPAPTPAPTPEPVVLAKDGVHTIPFAELEAARTKAAELAAQNAALQAQLAAAATPAAPAPTPAPVSTSLDIDKLREGVDFGDYSDESIAKASATIAARAGEAAAQAAIARMVPAAAPAVDPAVQAHLTAIYTAHPNLDSMAQSVEFNAWKAAQPSYQQPGIEHVLANGEAQQVIDLFNAFKQATQPAGTTPTASGPAAADPSATAEAAAAAAIAAAKAKPPTSLSEIPAGTQAHVDATAALLQASPQQLMARMSDMTPAQINELLSRHT
jgi:hypothetical protein